MDSVVRKVVPMVSIAAVFSAARLLALDLDGSPITNLGASNAYIDGDWLVYSGWESFDGDDLNEDGDRDDAVVHVHNLSTGSTTNLGLAGGEILVSGDRVLFVVNERDQDEDLNRDGEKEDVDVVHIHDLSTGETENLRLAGRIWAGLFGDGLFGDRVLWGSQNDGVLIFVHETSQGQDLNGDGDPVDENVLHVHNLSSGETTNLGLAVRRVEPQNGLTFVQTGDRLAFHVREIDQGKDLNGDGDDLDQVVHVHDLSTGETTNLRRAGWLEPCWRTWQRCGDWVVLRVDERGEGEDLNGDGDVTDSVVHVHNLVTSTTTNLRLVGNVFSCGGTGGPCDDRVVFSVDESSQGEDLNGDDDEEDFVFHVHDLPTGETTNLRLTGLFLGVFGDRLVVAVDERDRGKDLNGDGDDQDRVVHIHDLSSEETRNLMLSGSFTSVQDEDLLVIQSGRVVYLHDLTTGETATTRVERGARIAKAFRDWLVLHEGVDEDQIVQVHNVSTGVTRSLGFAGWYSGVAGLERWLVLEAYEPWQGEDLNGDGDRDDRVRYVHDLSSGETTNLGLVGGYWYRVSRERLIAPVPEQGQDEDLNRDGDIGDIVYHLVDLSQLHPSGSRFVRGDCNDDDEVDISDAVCILGWLFLGGDAPGCVAVANTNGDVEEDISDGVYLLSYLFLGGPAPASPFPECGMGTLARDETSCEITPGFCEP